MTDGKEQSKSIRWPEPHRPMSLNSQNTLQGTPLALSEALMGDKNPTILL